MVFTVSWSVKKRGFLFETLNTVFLNCGESWSETAFIFFRPNCSFTKEGKNQIENVSGEELLSVVLSLVKARVRVDFRSGC